VRLRSRKHSSLRRCVCANTSSRSRIAPGRETNSECFTLYGGRSNLIIYQVGRANLLKSFSDLDSVSKISSGAVFASTGERLPDHQGENSEDSVSRGGIRGAACRRVEAAPALFTRRHDEHDGCAIRRRYGVFGLPGKVHAKARKQTKVPCEPFDRIVFAGLDKRAKRANNLRDHRQVA
jgi:hypothetical protein